MGSDTREILEEFAATNGWDMDSMLQIVCDYVDFQQDSATFIDFLKHTAVLDGESNSDE